MLAKGSVKANLGEEPMTRTLEAIDQFRRAVRGHYVRLFAVATSALRRADNAESFAARGRRAAKSLGVVGAAQCARRDGEKPHVMPADGTAELVDRLERSRHRLLAEVSALTEPFAGTYSGTRVGEGLGESGHLGEEPMTRTLEGDIDQFRRAVRGHYVRLFAVATSALRRADNAEAFSPSAWATQLGVPLRILSGEEEADRSYRGALTALLYHLRGERVGVLDLKAEEAPSMPSAKTLRARARRLF